MMVMSKRNPKKEVIEVMITVVDGICPSCLAIIRGVDGSHLGRSRCNSFQRCLLLCRDSGEDLTKQETQMKFEKRWKANKAKYGLR